MTTYFVSRGFRSRTVDRPTGKRTRRRFSVASAHTKSKLLTALAFVLIAAGAGRIVAEQLYAADDLGHAAADRALIEAATSGNVALARFALKRGADPNAVDSSDDLLPALVIAARTGSMKIVELLLGANASPDAASKSGVRALMHAARGGNLPVTKRLIDAGADVNARDSRDGYSALLHAADSGPQSILSLLIEHNAQVNVHGTARGLTPLILCAARRTGFQMVVDLVAAGADVNAAAEDGFTPLMAASKHANDDSVEVLLLNGANRDATTVDDRSAFFVAAEAGALGVLRILLESRSANWAASAELDTGIKTALLDSALPAAVANGHGDAVELLLANGADPNVRTKNGQSSLHGAILANQIPLVRLLLRHGADPDAAIAPHAHTALMLAANRDMLDAVRYLLDAGARVDVTATDGWTAIQAAEMIGATDIVALLKQHR